MAFVLHVATNARLQYFIRQTGDGESSSDREGLRIRRCGSPSIRVVKGALGLEEGNGRFST